MSLLQLRTVNFGRNRSNATGSNGVGYELKDTLGATVSSRSVVGVHQLTSGSGTYAAYITFPNNFHGSILWDTGTAFPTASYAVDEYNVEENDSRVAETWQMVNAITGSIQFLRDMTAGRWRINGTTMEFYGEDNATLVASFSLFDNNGTPTNDAVFERIKN